MSRPVLVASDVHLGASPPEQERAFQSWLARARERASWIILNGDVFDFWFEYRWGTTAGHDAALALLKETVDGGVPITFMGGNHDWWGGRYLGEEIGLEVLHDPVVRRIAGRTALLAHGDGLGRGDFGYRVMRSVLRGKLPRFGFGLLPPSVGDAIARAVSKTETKWEGGDDEDRRRAAALAVWAEERLRADADLELVILGHTHEPVMREVEPGRWYVNAGDWVQHRSYVVLEDGAPPLLIDDSDQRMSPTPTDSS